MFKLAGIQIVEMDDPYQILAGEGMCMGRETVFVKYAYGDYMFSADKEKFSQLTVTRDEEDDSELVREVQTVVPNKENNEMKYFEAPEVSKGKRQFKGKEYGGIAITSKFKKQPKEGDDTYMHEWNKHVFVPVKGFLSEKAQKVMEN